MHLNMPAICSTDNVVGRGPCRGRLWLRERGGSPSDRHEMERLPRPDYGRLSAMMATPIPVDLQPGESRMARVFLHGHRPKN